MKGDIFLKLSFLFIPINCFLLLLKYFKGVNDYVGACVCTSVFVSTASKNAPSGQSKILKSYKEQGTEHFLTGQLVPVEGWRIGR
jgi:hypothetical protein